jgi:hypothetical protein
MSPSRAPKCDREYVVSNDRIDVRIIDYSRACWRGAYAGEKSRRDALIRAIAAREAAIQSAQASQ